MGNVSLRRAGIAAGDRMLLENIDLDIFPGELCAIVGPNGIGKTTLLRTMAGLHPCASGEILIGGQAPAVLSPRARAQQLAFISADAASPAGMSVRDVVRTGRFAHRRWWRWHEEAGDSAIADSALRRVGLSGFGERRCETLSSGERQRVWFALALAQEARTILVDEPTSHLDARYAGEVLRILRSIARSGSAVVVVLHDLNEAAAYADRIALLGDGRLLRIGPPREALHLPSLERSYGVPFEALEIAGDYRIVARTDSSRAVSGS